MYIMVSFFISNTADHFTYLITMITERYKMSTDAAWTKIIYKYLYSISNTPQKIYALNKYLSELDYISA